MRIAQLSEAKTTELRHAQFTYDPVGATAGVFPQGFSALHRARTLPVGTDLVITDRYLRALDS